MPCGGWPSPMQVAERKARMMSMDATEERLKFIMCPAFQKRVGPVNTSSFTVNLAEKSSQPSCSLADSSAFFAMAFAIDQTQLDDLVNNASTRPASKKNIISFGNARSRITQMHAQTSVVWAQLLERCTATPDRATPPKGSSPDGFSGPPRRRRRRILCESDFQGGGVEGAFDRRMAVPARVLACISFLVLLPGNGAFSFGPRHVLPARAAAATWTRTLGVPESRVNSAPATPLPRKIRYSHLHDRSTRAATMVKGGAGDGVGGDESDSEWKIINDDRTGVSSFFPPSRQTSLTSSSLLTPSKVPLPPPPLPFSPCFCHTNQPTS